MQKKNLLNNLKDYNNKLEKIIEKKDYSQQVKSLLLSMLYKIETSYLDYKKTKVNVLEKNEFIEEIIENIKNNCDKIEILNSQDDVNLKVNKKEKTIQTKQNEKLCMQAICEISQKEIFIQDKYNLIQKPIKEFLKTASIVNKLEVIRDFDGWTWYPEIKNETLIKYNVIYQDLILILGYKFFEDMLDSRDVLNDISIMLEKIYGKKISETIMYNFVLILSQIYYKNNQEKQKDLQEKRLNLEENLKEFENKKQFSDKLSTKKKQNLKKIEQIENLLNNKKLLEKEFVNRNKKNQQLFSINTLKIIIEREREQLIEQNKQLDDLRNPLKFAEKTKKIEEEYSFICEMQKMNIEENLFNMQEAVIQCLEKKVTKAETRKDIVNLFYKTRYFNMLKYSKNNEIYQIISIKEKLNSYISKLIIKAIETKTINTIYQNTTKDIEIFSELLHLRTIDLENIEYIIKKNKNNYIIIIYDEESIEYKKEINLISTKGIKINKKIKIFN